MLGIRRPTLQTVRRTHLYLSGTVIVITRTVLSPGNRAKPCKFRYVKSVRNFV